MKAKIPVKLQANLPAMSYRLRDNNSINIKNELNQLNCLTFLFDSFVVMQN